MLFSPFSSGLVAAILFLSTTIVVHADPQYFLYDFNTDLSLSLSPEGGGVAEDSSYSTSAVGYEVQFFLEYPEGTTGSSMISTFVDGTGGFWYTSASYSDTAIATMLLDGEEAFSPDCSMVSYTAESYFLLDFAAMDIETIEVSYAVEGSASLEIELSAFSWEETGECSICTIDTDVSGTSSSNYQIWEMNLSELDPSCVFLTLSFSLRLEVSPGSGISINRIELIPTYSGSNYIECLDVFSVFGDSINPFTISTLPGYYPSGGSYEETSLTQYQGTIFDSMSLFSIISETGEGYGMSSIWYDDTVFISSTGQSHFYSYTSFTFYNPLFAPSNVYELCPGSDVDGTREGIYVEIYADENIVPIMLSISVYDSDDDTYFSCEAVVDILGDVFIPFDSFRMMDTTGTSGSSIFDIYDSCEQYMVNAEMIEVALTSESTDNVQIRKLKIVQYQ